MAGWDDDDDETDDDDPETDPDFALTPTDWDTWDLPSTFESWWEFDWESYDGEYEEFAVSADYNGET